MIRTFNVSFFDLIKLLRNGEVACLPTDTVFSLSCDATNYQAVDNIFTIKKRPVNKQLPIFCYSLEHAQQYGYFSAKALALAHRFWPGKLTLIVPNNKKNIDANDHNSNAQNDVSNSINGSLNSQNDLGIAIRVPNNNGLLKIIYETKKPLIGTSANLSGLSTMYNIYDVIQQLSKSRATRLQNISYESQDFLKKDSSQDFSQDLYSQQKYNKTVFYYSTELQTLLNVSAPSTIVDIRTDEIKIIRNGCINVLEILSAI